jgi:glycosyltransferase involved in cell wall biosynthesis
VVQKLRIAFIGARGVIGTYSGIETYYEEVGSRLAARGHRVTAYCRTYFTPDVEVYRGVLVRRLPCLRSKHLETVSHSVLATLDCLFRDFDLVQYHAIGSAPLALLPRFLAGKKTVVSVRGLDWQRAKWGGFARRVLQAGEWASATCPSATAVVSAQLQRHYEAEHGRRPQFIPNAVDRGKRRPVEFLRQHQALRDLKLGEHDFLVFAARISPEKGLHELIEAWNGLKTKKKLLIAGGTSYTGDYIEKVQKQAGENVIFLGLVGREMMEALYSNCHAYILPSHMEGLSVGLLEAVSYGCCILTTNILENLEVVDDAALTFPPGDVGALRQALRRVLEEPETVAELRGRAASRALEQPDWDEVARRTEAFYVALVEGSSGGEGESAVTPNTGR